MATNIRFSMNRIPIAACTSAHNSGDLVYEGGYIGVAVETNAAGGPNTLIGPDSVVNLVVPGATAAGTKLYSSFTLAALVAAPGTTIQAIGTLTAPVTGLVTPDNHRTAAVTSLLNTTATNALVGTTVTASAAEGASTTAFVKLGPA